MNVTAIVAHCDDELMCAGTLARFAAEGHSVTIQIVCESEILYERDQESWAASEALGSVGRYSYAFPDDDLRLDRLWVHRGDQFSYESDLVISHRPDDTNQSHSLIGQIMRAACRKNNKTLWQLDQSIPGGWDATSPRPNHLVNITSTWSKKMDAVNCYKSQLDRYPQWWSAIEARDRHYGWMLDQGNNEITHAEGFIVEKSVWL